MKQALRLLLIISISLLSFSVLTAQSNIVEDFIARELIEKTGILDLSRHDLPDLPESLWELTHLTDLHINFTQLSTLPPEIAQLSNLERLWLDHNQLTTIPSELAQLHKLEELTLGSNQLSSLDIDFSNMPNLRILYLNNNQFTEIPPSLATASSLITACPIGLCESGFPYDGRFDLRDNPVQWPPAEFAGIPEEEIMRNVFISLNPDLESSLRRLELIDITMPLEFIEVQEGLRTDITLTGVRLLPTTLFNLENLETLRIEAPITSLPPEIGRLTNLRSLVLNSTELTSLPPEIGQLTNLVYLQISNSPLTELPITIENLVNLEELSLSSNELAYLPDEIGNLSKLRILNLASNPLTTLPLSISYLYELLADHHCERNRPCMGGLSIVGTPISRDARLSQGLEHYNTIIRPEFAADYAEYLMRQEDEYIELVAEIEAAKDATELYLDMGDYGHLPSAIGQLTELEILTIWTSGPLQSLPSEFVNLQNLRSLNIGISGASFTELPREIYALEQLEVLTISIFSLNTIPEGIANLSNLQELVIGRNQITGLPQDFGELENLSILRIEGTQLNSLPESFGDLQNLRELSLDNNQLSSLPNNMILHNLTQINLNRNRFNHFPTILLEMPQLCRISISMNEITILPMGLLWHHLGNCQYRLSLMNSQNPLILPNSFLLQSMGYHNHELPYMEIIQYSFFGTLVLVLIYLGLWFKNRSS